MAKIAIIAGYGRSLVNFRGDLIRAFIDQGHDVVAMAPEDDCRDAVQALGCRYKVVPLARSGMNPLVDLKTLNSLVGLLRDVKPDIVFTYTIKPVIYGSLAARIAGVNQINSMVTGLGYAFSKRTVKERLLRQLVKFLYKQALLRNKKVFFQNPDDMLLFTKLNLLPSPDTAVLINGSGVDISRFAFQKANIEPVSFLLMARLIWDKGIEDFVEAGRMLKKRYPNVRFKLLGPFEVSPIAINRDIVTQWVQEGVIEYLGKTDDVRPYITDSSVYVLPSYYPEGTPRSVLEAMAMGRPIITTNTPGCKETVKPGVNGFLVPPKDPRKLAAAMEQFILKPELILDMGAKSREIAEEKYDVRKVNQSILRAMELA